MVCTYVKTLKVYKCVSCQLLVQRVLVESNPRVIQSVLCTDSFLGVKCEELLDEVFSLTTDAVPLFFLETVATSLNFLDDLVLGFAVEGRIAYK